MFNNPIFSYVAGGGASDTNAGLATAAGSFGLEAYGADQANQTNKKLAQDQMKFQERMSSTAHQRQAADLEKAGLNRLLSLNTSGASTPQGATAQVGNVFEGLTANAQQAYNMHLATQKQGAEISLLNSQKANTDMDTFVKTKNLPEIEMKNKAYKSVQQGVEKLTNMFNTSAKSINNKSQMPAASKAHEAATKNYKNHQDSKNRKKPFQKVGLP